MQFSKIKRQNGLEGGGTEKCFQYLTLLFIHLYRSNFKRDYYGLHNV